jgi:hypothetical protein
MASAGEWRPAFLTALRNTANVRYACEQAATSRMTAYKHKREDAAFAAEWREALTDACDLLELEARRRAVEGSDSLLMKLLAAHRPNKYRENVKVDGRLDVHNRYSDLDELSAAELDAECRRLEAVLSGPPVAGSIAGPK